MATGQLVVAGTTDVSTTVRILGTDGLPKTDVVYNSAGIDLQYARDGGASTAITEASLSALTDAHADGGFLHKGFGNYRFDLPDAAVSAGAGVRQVTVQGTVTGGVVLPTIITMISINLWDAVRAGLSALPNAAAEAAGGLLTRGSGAGQINQNANGQIDVNLVGLVGSATAASLLQLIALVGKSGTVAASPTPTTKLFGTNLSSSTNNLYQDRMGFFTSGALTGHVFYVQFYDGGSNKSINTFKEMPTAPSNGDAFLLF